MSNSIIECVHKHKILKEVKKENARRLEKQRKLARSRTIQPFTTMAKTRMAVRKRRMLATIRTL